MADEGQEAEKAKNEEKLANLQKEKPTHAAKYKIGLMLLKS